jgi:hypothetical protein
MTIHSFGIGVSNNCRINYSNLGSDNTFIVHGCWGSSGFPVMSGPVWPCHRLAALLRVH